MARWRRKLLRWALGLIGLVVVVGALALLALAHLDARPMKGWLVGAAARQGVALDFDVARVTLGGVRLAGVRVASPAPDAGEAPSLFAIGAIDGSWSPLAKRVDELVIKDVAVTIVRAADGTTSLDRWIAGIPSSPPSGKPSAPLSAALRGAVPAGVEAHVRVEGVTVTLIDHVAPGRRIALTGLAARVDLVGGGLTLALGPGPVRVAVTPLPGGAEVSIIPAIAGG